MQFGDTVTAKEHMKLEVKSRKRASLFSFWPTQVGAPDLEGNSVIYRNTR